MCVKTMASAINNATRRGNHKTALKVIDGQRAADIEEALTLAGHFVLSTSAPNFLLHAQRRIIAAAAARLTGFGLRAYLILEA